MNQKCLLHTLSSQISLCNMIVWCYAESLYSSNYDFQKSVKASTVNFPISRRRTSKMYFYILTIITSAFCDYFSHLIKIFASDVLKVKTVTIISHNFSLYGWDSQQLKFFRSLRSSIRNKGTQCQKEFFIQN